MNGFNKSDLVLSMTSYCYSIKICKPRERVQMRGHADCLNSRDHTVTILNLNTHAALI